MKRLFVLFVLVILTAVQPVMAKNVKVEAMSDFSTANPPKTWQVKVVEGFVAKNGYAVSEGSVFEGKIEDVKNPKRLKRNAVFTFVPTVFHDSKTGQSYTMKQNFRGKYSSIGDITVKSVAKTGAVAVGNQVIGAFVGPGVALVEGVVKNEEGNRAKSALVSVYESTPLSYVNKGKELEIVKGQRFTMSFKLADEDEEEDNSNYSYTTE